MRTKHEPKLIKNNRPQNNCIKSERKTEKRTIHGNTEHQTEQKAQQTKN